MIVLGIVLLIIGVVLLLAPIPYPNVDAVGWLLILVGVVLLLIGLLLGSDLNLGDGNDRAGAFGFLWVALLRQSAIPRAFVGSRAARRVPPRP